MNNSIVKHALAWRARSEEYFFVRAKKLFKHALAWLEQCEEYFYVRAKTLFKYTLAWRARCKKYLFARAQKLCKHALAWLEQCEEYFLGRGRQNASRAVQDAIDMQSPDEVAKFETADVCCLGLYKLPLSDIVLAVKKQRWSRAGTALGTVLARKVALKLGVTNSATARNWIVVPIPTPFLRRVMRGIDHSDLIASALANELRLPLRRALSQRFGRTQKTLNRSGRLQRLQRFALRRWHGSKVVGKNILLVDDIRTTGATLAQASQVLLQAGAARVASAVVCMVEK